MVIHVIRIDEAPVRFRHGPPMNEFLTKTIEAFNEAEGTTDRQDARSRFQRTIFLASIALNLIPKEYPRSKRLAILLRTKALLRVDKIPFEIKE